MKVLGVDPGLTVTSPASNEVRIEFTGGANGSLLARDTADTVDGLTYVAAGAGFLAATGAAQMPAFTGDISKGNPPAAEAAAATANGATPVGPATVSHCRAS